MARQIAHKPDQFQQQAINSTARGIRIVAPAGSGKSETLARRVAKRIDEDGVDPRRILILTFDNAAKKSLSGFFGQVLDRRQMPQIRTLNGHGNRILGDHFPREKADLIGNIPTSEARAFIRKTNAIGYEYPVLGWDGVPRSMRDVFLALKNQGFYPGRAGERERQTTWLKDEYLRLPREGESATFDDYWGMPSSPSLDDTYAGQLAGVIDEFGRFEEGLRELGLMEFTDQKARAVHQLWRSKAACEKVQAEFDEIVVDECQDISRLDAMLVYYSAAPTTLVVLAGDDDQTLYEFRNAHSLYLRKPEIVFRDIEFETIHLNLNYRSPQEILGPAVKMISNNVERIEKSPSSGVTTAGELLVRPAGSHRIEQEMLVKGIQEEIDAGTSPGDIAVLVHARDHQQVEKAIGELLKRAGIPVVETDRNEQVLKAGVWVRSFLKAKGRQWQVVFVPNLSDRELPDMETVRKQEVESARRKLYVAMTRARRKLVLSYVRGGDADRIDFTAEGEVVATNGASRFLFEAGVVKPEALPEPQAETPSDAEVVPAPKSPDKKQPDPDTVQAPAPKKGRLKPWEPRQEDTRKLVKAKSEYAAGDYDNAVLCAWKPIEKVLRRMVTVPPAKKSVDAVVLIDEGVVQRIFDIAWKDDLHLWRQVRNQAFHDEEKSNRFPPKRFQDIVYTLVERAPEFFDHLADRHAPKQLVLETRDEFLTKLSNLVTLIQLDKPSPIKKKPIRAIRFDPDQNQFEVLAMQMLMVLRDVRFYVPEEYRWSSSPIVGKFAVDAIGHLPGNMRTVGSNKLRMPPGEQLNQLMARLESLVKQECGDANPGEYMKQRLEDGLALENGNFHAGLKLNPRSQA